MSRRFHLSRRRRILWIGMVFFCLLFEQLAMASYACAAVPVAQGDNAPASDCAAMGMASKAPVEHAHSSPDPRCAEHCAGNVTSTPDVRLPAVPPLMLPPASPALMGTIAHAPEQVALPDPTQRASGPPPTLRFCSLLI